MWVEEGKRRVPPLPLGTCVTAFQGGEECIITSTQRVAQGLAGKGGTHIITSWGSRRFPFSKPKI